MSPPPPLPLELPYTFDTRQHGRALVYVVLVSTVVMLAALALCRTWMPTPALRLWVPVGIAVVIALELVAGFFVFRAAGGAFGTVGRVHVTVEPDRFWGMTTRTHRGTFPTTDFRAVELGRIGGGQGPVGVLHLHGKNPLLKLTIAAAPYATLKPVAAFLSRELNLTLIDPTP